MSALADKLRGLRRQAGVLPPAPAPVPTPAPARQRPALPDNIAQLLGIRQRVQGSPPRRKAVVDPASLPGVTIAPGLQLCEARSAWPPAPPAFHAGFARIDEVIDPTRLFLFDTETTGLAGGTGTRAFMIGVGDWHEGGFRERQLLITTLAGEAAMLECFATWLRPDAVLVSYNGKSYDAPLLKTRFRLQQRTCPLEGLAHIDLLHPVRRRWRGAWENCRLATAERKLLQVVREDDLPGSEAPAAWLGFLRGGPTAPLHQVARHNSQDLRSLGGILHRFAAHDDSVMAP
ncbi:ribonuclease H-like domain-containing protein [Dyella telluris]|uniref:Ribonuclease H-like domain-containing protein n=1 Tax=Dyella telluris TaxID=2763498 RepID=A0A7G8PZ31_9GAMM|nr:ribonuclease H-like domain-containing protein [Dyella telluris]QNJ99788.1 ribonuclease H-like domain-containing protein [Dyella telluris]